jgi:hypothetical protein
MSKASRAQYIANHANSKYSHGPRSAEGKQRSSQNALRHGLSGRIVVLPTEDMEAYRKFSKELVDSLHPETPMEIQFAETVADNQWRLNRARTIEDGMLAMGHFEAAGNFNTADPNIHAALTAAKVFREHSKDFANLTLYEQRIQRAQKEAFVSSANRRPSAKQPPPNRCNRKTDLSPGPQPPPLLLCPPTLPARLASFVRPSKSLPRRTRKHPRPPPKSRYKQRRPVPPDVNGYY